MTNKNSLIFYYEWLPLIASLANASKLRFYEIITNPDLRDIEINDDPHLKGIVDFIKIKIFQNEAKYNKVIESRKLAGAKGGKQKVANASKPKQKVANVADNVNVNENVNDIKKERPLRIIPFLQKELPSIPPEKIETTPLDYMPDPFLDIWIKRFGGPSEELDLQWEKFTRHFTGLDCKKPARLDWQGTWFNWITR